MKKLTILIAIMIFVMANNINAQQNYQKWVVPTNYLSSEYIPYQLTFTADGIEYLELTHQDIPDPGPSYCYFSAGGYDDNYDRLFYVLGENYFYGTSNDNWINPYEGLYPEYQIIKKPQSNNEYFSFFSRNVDHHARHFYYNIITYDYQNSEPNFGSPTQVSPGTDFDYGFSAFAITKESNNERFLFQAATEADGGVANLSKWTISSNGLSSKITIVDADHQDLVNSDFDAYNLEIKPITDNLTDEIIAWIHGDNENNVEQIIVVVDGTPLVIDLELGRIGGIEFSNYEDNMLYVSTTNGGIVKIDYTSYQNTSDIIVVPNAPSNDYGRTFLQTAPDGHIYGVSNDGTKLGVIYQYDDDNQTEGTFESDVFTFLNGTVATFRIFIVDNTNLNYFILPENSDVYIPMVAEAWPTEVSCPGYSDGSVIIPVSGGVAPYSISSPQNIQFSWNEDEQYFYATGLAEGTYYYTISDEYGSLEGTFTIGVDFSDYTYLEHKLFTSNVEWNDDIVSFAKGFTLEEGITLTFNNTTILMGPDASIYIKAGTVEDLPNNIPGVDGAKMILNHTTLTHHADCNITWHGIQVWGITNQSQFTGPDGFMYQGELKIENGSIIKNARNAITTHNPDNFNSHGGIVSAENSNFENNIRSVEIMQYENFNPYSTDIKLPYLSRFKGCNFEINDNYLFNTEMYAHVSLWDVYGINFFGCGFYNNNTSYQNTGTGILSLDAGYSLLEYCTNTSQPCNDIIINEFHNLYKGIHAGNSSSNNIIYVNNADFINNSIGVYISTVNNAIIINSNFEVGYNEGDKAACGELASGFGIDIHESIGFVFENNDFEKYEFAPNDTYTGIRVYECPSPHDIIYKNTFDGLSFGNYAEGTNRKYRNDDQSGVEYQCNTNTNNAVDFIVTAEETEDAMIRTDHGTEETASGNTFSPNAKWHFRNEGTQTINWFYDQYNSNEFPEYVYTLDPIYFHAYTSTNTATCPDNHGGSSGEIKLSAIERQQIELDYAQASSDYTAVSSLYESLVDGGNTDAELNEIVIAQPDDMWTLRSSLLGDSPHLSQEVLRQMANRTDVFPDDILLEILSANPDELKKDTLLNYLELKENPLPLYMIDILRQVANGVSYKTVLKRQMAGYFGEKTQAAQDIVHSILSDSVIDQDDYRNWLDNIGSINTDKQIVASYLADNDTASAMTLLNIIPSIYGLEGIDLANFNIYHTIVQMQIDWRNTGTSIFNIDSTDILILNSLAQNNNGTYNELARNILVFTNDEQFCYCVHQNDSSYFKSAGTTMEHFILAYGPEISVETNPVSTYAAFNYILRHKGDIGRLEVSDMSGRIIHQSNITGKKGQYIWDTRTIKSGVYIFTLFSNGLSKSGKIIIK
ncbi:MAG: T9SS type A sorting domain-containing protein [Bacteroidota bacterium]